MENKKTKNIELLAPAGNMEKMKTALAFGADAVYAGIPDFSLRVRINDFDLEKIAEATEYCHANGKKIYVTVNIFAHNKHLEKLPSYIKELKKIGVDALIISDPGVMQMVRNVWPDAEIHLSTQANCTNVEAAKFWLEQGVQRVILGREVTLDEIKEIHKALPELELEYFVHGAMCMSYSGRCFLSKEMVNRSANLGDCVQPCRWSFEESGIPSAALMTGRNQELDKRLIKPEGHDEKFELIKEEHGSYILNSKDLCLLEHVQNLIEAGVTSLKIEGRAKSVYYQAVVNGIYSRVTNNFKDISAKEIRELQNELETKLVHRGYTKGFLLGEKAEQNIKASHNKCEWEFCGVVQSIENYELRITNFDIKNKVLVKVHNTLRVGDEIEIVQPGYELLKFKLEKMWEAETGEDISEAHGGQERKVLLEVPNKVPEFSVLRRKITSL